MPDSSRRRPDFPVGESVTIEQLDIDPKPVIAELRRHEPVSWVPAIGAWFVTRRDLALIAMRDAEVFTVDDPRFTTAAVLGPSMLSLEGAEHERHRAPFAPAFRPAALREGFESYLADEVARLIEAIDGQVGDLRHDLAGPLAVNTITRFLGLEGVTAGEVLDWYRSISSAITDLSLGHQVAPDRADAVAQLRRRVEDTLAVTDSESLLAAVARSGVLGHDELATSTAVLMFGAIETAEGMTANALWHLLATQGAWQEIGADRTLLANAIEESLRHEPAAAVVDRYTTSDVGLGDVTIPAGDLVTISLLGANHDPAFFADPHRFDLRRPNPRQHVAFVQGPHTCIGHHLSRMETAAALHGLLDAAPDLELEPGQSGPTGLIFRKPATLRARW